MKSRSHNQCIDERFPYEKFARPKKQEFVISREKAVEKGMVTEVSKFVPFESTINNELTVLDFSLVNLIDAGVDMTPLIGFSRPNFAVVDSVDVLTTSK